MDGDDLMAGSKTTRKPPKMRELLQNPLYRKMMVTPVNPPAFSWSIFALKTDGRWTGKTVAGYGEGFSILKVLLNQTENFADVALVSKARLFGPPVKYLWEDVDVFDWCGRCRRPTTFKRDQGLHALRNAPILSSDEPYRCYFCGMRKVNQPEYHPIMYTAEELAAIAKAEQEEVFNDKPSKRR